MSRNELEELRRLEELERRATQERGRQRYEDSPGWQKAVAGLGRPWYELAAGVKTLTGGELSPQEQERLAMFQSAGNDLLSIPGLARMAGEIPQYAGASGGARAGAKAAGRALPRAMGRRAATRAPGAIGPAGVAREAAAAASVGAVRQPAQGQTRGTNAAVEAIGAIAGEAVGKIARGVTPTPDARALLDRGVPLTPGQMSSGRFLPTAERLVGGLPLARRMLQRRQGEAVDAFNRSILQEASPPRPPLVPRGMAPPTTQGDIRRVAAQFNQGYDQLFGGTLQLKQTPSQAWKGLRREFAEQGTRLPDRAARRFTRNLTEVADLIGKETEIPGRTFQQADRLLREQVEKAAKKGNGVEAEMYTAARERLKDALPDPVRSRLEELNQAYAKFKVVERAAAYKAPAGNEGAFTPDDLLRASIASNNTGGKSRVARGLANFQDTAAQANRVFNQVGTPDVLDKLGVTAAAVGTAVANPALAAAGAATAPLLLSRAGQRMFSPREKAALLADMLRRMGASPGAIGAAAARPAQEQDRRPVLSRRTVGPVKAEDLLP